VTNEDDRLSLPQPPPPAPARREAAIAAAMRRFDAGDAVADASEVPTSRPHRSIFRRPQIGILVAASLVAVIGAPLAWRTATQKTTPATELAARNLKTFDVEEPPPAAKPPGIVFEPQGIAPPPITATDVPEGKVEAEEAAAPPTLVEGKTAREAAPDDRHELAVAQLDARAAAMMAPPAAPAPPPAVMKAEAPTAAGARADRASPIDNIVVTAAKRRGKAVPTRGDWNICTIDDPQQSLAACKSLINPAAKGLKGKAAAHIADGLSFAWAGDMGRAVAAFSDAIAIAPRSSIAYLNRALVYRRQGDEHGALADLDESVRLAPGSARAYYHRSQVQSELGNEKAADSDEQRAIDLDERYEVLVN